MRIIVTAEELVETGVWEDFCEQRDISVWSLQAGMDYDHEFSLTPDEAREFGFIN